jgi:hypothetical protein
MPLGVSVNLVAVLVAAVVAEIVGFLWYGPLFGKAWQKLSGVTPKQLADAKKKGMGKSFLMGFISVLVMTYVVAVFIGLAGAQSITNAVIVAFWIWLGFIATTTLGSVLWEFKPGKLWWLNNVFNIINLEIIAIILVMWP